MLTRRSGACARWWDAGGDRLPRPAGGAGHIVFALVHQDSGQVTSAHPVRGPSGRMVAPDRSVTSPTIRSPHPLRSADGIRAGPLSVTSTRAHRGAGGPGIVAGQAASGGLRQHIR